MTATLAPSRSSALLKLSRVARWIGLAVVVFSTMEIGARLDDHVQYGAPMIGNYDFDRLFFFDGKIVRGQPNSRYMKWSLNDLGLRGPNPDLSRSHTRVLVYGASEVFGLYETPGQDFPRRLEVDLRSRANDPELEVINAGIPGMRIGSGAEYLRTLGDQLKPSVVVLYPTPTHYTGVTKPHCGRPERAPGGQSDSVWPSSRLIAKAVDRIKEVMPRPMLHQVRRAAIAWKTRGAPTISAVDEASLGALEGDLRCAIRAVHAIGAQPVLLTHANRFGNVSRPDDAYWLTGWRNQYPEFGEAMLLDLERRSNGVIERVAKDEQVPLVDVAATLSGQPQYFADHAHFNDEGATRMGQVLATALAPLLPKH